MNKHFFKCVDTYMQFLQVLLAIIFNGHVHAEDIEKIQVSPIVISASGHEQEIKDAPASIEIIEQKVLEEKGYRDLTDALSGIEGVHINGTANQTAGNGEDITIRGMPGQYTLILVDGKRINSRETRINGNSGFEQGWLPPIESIKRIEIIRGPMTSLYGADAIGGVINVITKKVSNNWHSSIKTEGTMTENKRSGDSYGTSLYTSGPLIKDKLGTAFSGNYFRRGEDDILNGFNQARNYNVNAKLNYALNLEQNISTEYGKSAQNIYTDPGKSTSVTKEAQYLNNRENWSVSHEGDWENLQTQTNIYQEKIKREMIGVETGSNSSPTEAKNLVAETKLISTFDKNILTYGVQWRKDQININSFTERICIKNGGCPQGTSNSSSNYKAVTKTIDLSLEQKAIFAEDEYGITQDLKLIGGLRVENHQIYGTELIPRGYAVYQLNSNWTLKTGASKGLKNPSPRQILPEYAVASGGLYNAGSIAIVGNADLKPESSVNKEISVSYFDLKNFNFTLTYFQNDFKNKFTEVVRTDLDYSSRFPGAQIRQTTNIGKALIKGIESNIQYSFNFPLSLKLAYSFIDSKILEDSINKQNGRPLGAAPKNSINLNANYSFARNLKVWSSWNYLDRQIVLGRATALPAVIPSYNYFDLGFNYDFDKALALNMAIYNVGNKVTYYTEDNLYIDGRRYWVGIVGKF
jgi:outer membrane receptor for ferrienterochelin and colicins